VIPRGVMVRWKLAARRATLGGRGGAEGGGAVGGGLWVAEVVWGWGGLN